MIQRDQTVRAPALVVEVPESKAAVERVKTAGGKIVKDPYPVGDMGIVSYFQDLEGNVLGLWQTVNK